MFIFTTIIRPHQGIGNITIPDYISDKKMSNINFNINKIKRKTFLNGRHSYYYLSKCA